MSALDVHAGVTKRTGMAGLTDIWVTATTIGATMVSVSTAVLRDALDDHHGLTRAAAPHTVHSRWKYAEEHAKDLIDKGHLIRVTVRPDVRHVDDGDVYIHDEFIVEDLGARP